MDEMTKQGIAARMAKAAIELDRLEKEKKETVREYNEQINDVQDEIISLARQYEGAEAQPSLFDVPLADASCDVEEQIEDAKEILLLPAYEPEGEGEPEATYEAGSVLNGDFNPEDILLSEQIYLLADTPDGTLEALFGSFSNPANGRNKEYRWSVKKDRHILLSGSYIGYSTDATDSPLQDFPLFIGMFIKSIREHMVLPQYGNCDALICIGFRKIIKDLERWSDAINEYLDKPSPASDDELPFPETEEPQELKYIPSEEELTENPKIRPLTEHDFPFHNEETDKKRRRRVKRGAL